MDTPQNLIIPKDYPFGETAFNIHAHSPSSGGKICWNNVQLINMWNSIIRQVNKTINEYLGAADGGIDHIPYIATPENPTQAYNVHHHTSEYDGGLLFSGTIHDHRSMGQCGYAYATYHPATNIPTASYEREQIFGS